MSGKLAVGAKLTVKDVRGYIVTVLKTEGATIETPFGEVENGARTLVRMALDPKRLTKAQIAGINDIMGAPVTAVPVVLASLNGKPEAKTMEHYAELEIAVVHQKGNAKPVVFANPKKRMAKPQAGKTRTPRPKLTPEAIAALS